MLRRWRARRKMRWAVKHRNDWKAQFWIKQRRKVRQPRDWPVITVTSIYGWAETDAS